PCFAIRGAHCARQLTGEHRLSDVIAESIAMHLNLTPATDPLSYLLQQGAAIDCVGWDLAKVAPHKDAVLAAHPRLDCKRQLVETLRRAAHAHPGTRLSMMMRFGFFRFIDAAPFAE